MSPAFTLEPAQLADLEALVTIRIDAMRESLTRIGRFDPDRARERFASGFDPRATRHISCGGERVGFVVVKQQQSGLLLDHLYLRPSAQGQGLGSAVLNAVIAEAAARGQVLFVGALRDSAANRFYERHGFQKTGESEWDVYYQRSP